ncbi:hypothetical protein MFIFM68171_02145 [Madurella fahalii]|uniref:Uncharacterized protein n=1 Tax=Madurella fahalii TaxID=1157608 RepID=A0ABQ0G2H8_9PEZI
MIDLLGTNPSGKVTATVGEGWRIIPQRPVLFLSLLLNAIALWRLLGSKTICDRILTYSPALPAIENERVVFSSAFGIERSPFQGPPNEENGKLWAGLYDFGVTSITADEARPMDNKDPACS